MDDPSANRKPLDPNDKNKTPGIYDATANTGNYYYGPPLTYDKDHDNRGTIHQAPAAPCPFGLLEGDSNFDGIVSLNFQPGDTLKTLWFKTSLHPGDNYRVAAVFDSLMLSRLENEDGKHGIHVHDSKAGRVPFDATMVSPVLTVWRLFNLEVATMENVFGYRNKVQGWIRDFDGQGGRASSAFRLIIDESIYDLEAPLNNRTTNLRGLEEHFPNSTFNPPSLDDNSSPTGKGRFENGYFSLGTNSTPVGDIKASGSNYLILKHNTPLSGAWMTFELSPPTGTTITGYVQDIQKNQGGSFTFTLSPNNPLTGIGNNAVFRAADGRPMNIVNINPSNNTITTDSLSLLVLLSDDDREANHQVLPYSWQVDPLNLKRGFNIFREAYLETVIRFTNPGDTIPFRSNILTDDSFNVWIKERSTFWRTEVPASGGDKYGVWLGLVALVWQSSYWRSDLDPDSEVLPSFNGGVTLSVSDSTKMWKGGDVSVIPFEHYYDRYGNTSSVAYDIAVSVVHEIGHQFGLWHVLTPNVFMNPVLLQNSITRLEADQKNYIRCRKSTPGLHPYP
ncbi:MAG: hypothetical protein KF852_00640 [Saprospiraceae bacterium]|nr:hypothetical protein [Saprospiraceae bacterium]